MCGCVAVAVEGGQGGNSGWECTNAACRTGCVCKRERERVNDRAASQTNVADDIDAAKPALASASRSKFPNFVC